MRHIYIIENDTSILEALTFLLKKTYKVTRFTDARSALNNLEFEKPNLILLDFLMPELNGLAFIETLSQQQLRIPILIITGCATVDEQLKGFIVAGIIPKPFQIETIETKIKQLISN